VFQNTTRKSPKCLRESKRLGSGNARRGGGEKKKRGGLECGAATFGEGDVGTR